MKGRKTEAKAAILKHLKQSNEALSHEKLQSELGVNADRATIYRVLNRFYEDGLVHKVVGDDGRQYFAFCTNCGENRHYHRHFHFRCRKCGKVECLPGEVVVPLPEGYTSESFNGWVSGYCSGCA